MVSDSLGKTPISEENPCGFDITYEPEFEALQQEIDRLSIVSAAQQGVDWEKVVSLSESILENKSKHLLTAVYLSQGLIKTKGFKGLKTGTIIISDILENYWDFFYPLPKRKKGRINAIKWWYDKTDLFLKNIDSHLKMEKEDADSIIEKIKNINSIFSEKIEDSPILNTLVQSVEKIPLQNAAEEKVKSQPENQTETFSEKNNTDSKPASQDIKDKIENKAGIKEVETKPSWHSTISDGINNDNDAANGVSQGFNILIKTGNYLFLKDISNPLPYKISRLYTWAQIDQLPMTEKNSKTVLPPPDSSIKRSLDSMLASKDYESVVITAEDALRSHLFWLDLNRYSWTALDEMGGKFIKAKINIETETSGFVKKLISLENLSFSDGTPFADNETRAWLKSISGGTDDSDEAFSPGGDEIYLNVLETEKKAEKLFKEKKAYEAVSLFEKKLIEACSLREKILFQIYLSKFFMGIGKPELSFPHLEKIESNINDFHLEEYEPKIAVQGYTLIYKAYKDSNDENLVLKSSRYLNKISVINPASAFKLTSA